MNDATTEPRGGECYRCGAVTANLLAGLWVCDTCAERLRRELS